MKPEDKLKKKLEEAFLSINEEKHFKKLNNALKTFKDKSGIQPFAYMLLLNAVCSLANIEYGDMLIEGKIDILGDAKEQELIIERLIEINTKIVELFDCRVG